MSTGYLVTPRIASAETTQDALRQMPLVIRAFFVADALVVMAAVVNYAVALYLRIEQPSFLRLNAESNLPTWYSAFQLGVVGALFGCLAIREIGTDPKRWCIALPALMFLFFSLDEAGMVHERIGDWLRAHSAPPAANEEPSNNGPAMMICAPMVIFAVVFMVRYTRRYWVGRRGVAAKFLIGMAVFLFCAAGLEILINHVHVGLLTRVENLVEESGEMVGATIVLWSALELLAAEKLNISFDRHGMHFI